MNDEPPEVEGVAEVLKYLFKQTSIFDEVCLEQSFLLALAHQDFAGQLAIYLDFNDAQEVTGIEFYDDEFAYLDMEEFPGAMRALLVGSEFCDIDVTTVHDEGGSEGQVTFLTEELDLEGFFETHRTAIERGMKLLMNLTPWQIYMRDYVYKLTQK